MTSLIPLWELPGGIHPIENKNQSLQLPIGHLPLAPRLVIPLNQHMGTAATPVVQIGDSVLKGQLIGAAEGTFSANTHASTSGKIIALGEFAVPHPSGMTAESIVIEPDGKDEWIGLNTCEDYLSLDRLVLLDKIRAAGVAGLGGAGFPTAVKLAPKSTQVIDTLIINGAECEPYITADDILMQERADQLVQGILLTSHILHHPKNILVGIEDNKSKAIAAVKTAVEFAKQTQPEAANIKVVSFPTKYPSGGAKQLTYILTGREIPSGHHSADIGMICVNVATTIAAWRAVRFGEPLISRITTLVGQSLREERNLELLIGTPIDYVLQQQGCDLNKASRVIMGGPMMGFTLPGLDLPVIKTTNCLLAPTAKELPLPDPAQACIRCGLCAEVCPAGLLPQQLFWYAQAEDFDRLETHNLFDCIECGACSYVCPSSIPLVQYYRAAKGSIRQHLIEKEKSDRSRQRFEFRKERLAKEEAEKEAKRLARQKAAEEMKKQLAAKQTDGSSSVDLAKTATSELSAEDQKAKLERLVVAAKNALEFAQKPLVSRDPKNKPITEEQLEKQAARVKQAELKLAEAEKKLAEFAEQSTSNTVTSAAPTNEDPVTAAIARAQAKMSLSPIDKLKADLESLQTRLQKAQEKVEIAKTEGSHTLDALQQGAEKLQQKIAQTQASLKKLGIEFNTTRAISPPEKTAAEIAIDKAKTKAAALANMSDEEKRAEQKKSLTDRIQKARDRLAKAELENDVNLEVFKNSLEKLEVKLKEL